MLTDTQCRTAKPKEKLYRLNDFNGLYLEVKPNGKKAWRYRFKLNGKSSMFALGEYPTVKLAEVDCPQNRRQILSSRRGPFKGLRTDAAKVTVAPGPVVEHFNVIEDIRPGQIPGFVYSLPDAFFFQ